MNKQLFNSKWIYGLLLFPVISAILALCYHNFVFKSGVAGFGILILLLLYLNRLKQSKEVWLIICLFPVFHWGPQQVCRHVHR